MSELPDGWVETSLDKLTEQKSGNSSLIKGKLSKVKEECLYPAFSASGQDVWHSAWEQEGDAIIVSAVGARCGKCFKATGKWSAIANTHVVRTNPHVLDLSFLYHRVNDENYWVKGGTAQPFVKVSNSFERPFNLPPLNEQRRIVAKIEELFSELDKGVESLKAAKAQLVVYRQSVLKAAFEGRLTEAWRAEHAEELESAEELLVRIKAEREARYEAQLAEWQASGGMIDGKKASKPKKPKELPPLTANELADLPELPEGWGWSHLGTFIDQIEAGKSFKCDEREPADNEIGVAKVSAVTWGDYNESESKTCTDQSKVNKTLFIQPGDFLFSRANTIELVGACVIAKKVHKKVMLSDKTLRIFFALPNQEYFLFYLRSRMGRNEIERLSTGNQESMRNIGQERIRRIILPTCGEKEMDQIIQEIESRFSVVEKMEQTIEESLQKAEALRQSILKRAFEGKLVPQDPTDEPASELLARIRAERKTIQPSKQTRKRA